MLSVVSDELADAINAFIDWDVGVKGCYVCCDKKCIGW